MPPRRVRERRAARDANFIATSIGGERSPATHIDFGGESFTRCTRTPPQLSLYGLASGVRAGRWRAGVRRRHVAPVQRHGGLGQVGIAGRSSAAAAHGGDGGQLRPVEPRHIQCRGEQAGGWAVAAGAGTAGSAAPLTIATLVTPCASSSKRVCHAFCASKSPSSSKTIVAFAARCGLGCGRKSGVGLMHFECTLVDTHHTLDPHTLPQAVHA